MNSDMFLDDTPLSPRISLDADDMALWFAEEMNQLHLTERIEEPFRQMEVEEDEDVVFLSETPAPAGYITPVVKREVVKGEDGPIPAIVLSYLPAIPVAAPVAAPPVRHSQWKKKYAKAKKTARAKKMVKDVLHQCRVKRVQRMKKTMQVTLKAAKWARHVRRAQLQPVELPMCNGFPVERNPFAEEPCKPSRVTLNKTRLRFKYLPGYKSAARKDAKGKLRANGFVQMVGVQQNEHGNYHPVFNYPTYGEIAKTTMKKAFKHQDCIMDPKERVRFCSKLVDKSRSFTPEEMTQLQYHMPNLTTY